MRPNLKTDVLVATYDNKDLSQAEQNKIKEDFRNGKTQVLFGGPIVEQGFNVERASVVVLAAPAKSGRLIKQLLWRVQREFKDKKEAYLVDFVDKKVGVLLYQFYARNRRVYKPGNYRKI